MARKKAARKKKTAGKKKSTLKKNPAGKKKSAATKKRTAKKKSARRKKSATRARRETTFPITLRGRRGFDSGSAGQSGDIQGLSRREDEDSESVAELVEEGQDFEAEAVSGVEDAKDPDQGEVTTSEVPEDDVPPEYLDEEKS